MLGRNISEPGAYWQTQGFGTTPWPQCGEIDIMEHWGHNQDYVSSAIHTPSSFGGTVNVGGRFIPGVSDAFHVYQMEWTADSIIFSVDGQVHYTYAPTVKDADTWPFDDPQYILMNVAILPTIEPSFTQSAMVVDYVRVYQKQSPSGRTAIEAPTPKLYPNPASDQLYIDFGEHSSTVVSLRFFDTVGRLVYEYNLYAPQSTQLVPGFSTLSKGMYQCEIQYKDHHFTLPLIKH